MTELTINLAPIKELFSDKEKMQKYIDKESKQSFELPMRFQAVFDKEEVATMLVYRSGSGIDSIVYIPGGGFLSHPSDYQLKFAKELAENTNKTVYTLIYPKIPRHSRDYIVNSVKNALIELNEQSNSLSLVGDSAGCAIMMSAMDELKIAFKNIVYLSPLVDLRYNNLFQKELEKEDEMLAFPGVEMLADLYRDGYDPSASEVSPILLNRLRKSPALIIVGTKEMMLHDARQLDRKYTSLKIPHRYYEVDEMMHDFMFYPIEQGKKYRALIFDYLQT